MSNDSSRQIGEYSGKHRTLEARAGIRNGVKRLIFVLISILLEIVLFIVAFVGLHQYAGWILIITRFAATILILMIYSQDSVNKDVLDHDHHGCSDIRCFPVHDGWPEWIHQMDGKKIQES